MVSAWRAYSAPTGVVTEDVIKAKLVEALQPSQIQVVDTSGMLLIGGGDWWD